MTNFLLLHADRDTSLLVDDPIVPAGDVARFGEIAALLDAAAALRRDADSAYHVAREEARAGGYAEGERAGRAAGEAAIRDELLRLAQADAARGEAQRADLARLALEVVRRIAGELGADVVAGIATRAAQDIAPNAHATIRVHPDAVDATRTRLEAGGKLAIVGDASLDAADCIIETPLGRTHAGLETQLAHLQRAWGLA